MDERQAWAGALEAAAWDDETVRTAYADWLDDRGEHDEAARQLRVVPARRWLRAYAERLNAIPHGIGGPDWGDGDAGEYPDLDWEKLVAAAERFLQDGTELHVGMNITNETLDDGEEFWRHACDAGGFARPSAGKCLPPFACDC